jgi:hypothetical protein
VGKPGSYSANGGARLRTSAARVAELVGQGKRVLVAGAECEDLLVALHENVCDVVLVGGASVDADALCERVLRRPLAVDQLVAAFGDPVFDAVVLDGVAATATGVIDLRQLVEDMLPVDGLLLGRLPVGASVPGLADSGLTILSAEAAGDDPQRTIYVAFRLPRIMRSLVEARLARLEEAELETSALRRSAAGLASQLDDARATVDRLASRLARAVAEASRRAEEFAALQRRLTDVQSALREAEGAIQREAALRDRAAAIELELVAARARSREAEEELAAARERVRDAEARRKVSNARAEEELAAARERVRNAEAGREALNARAERLESRDAEWRRLLIDAHEQLLERDEELAAAYTTDEDSGYFEYRAVVSRVRELVMRHVPIDVPVVVASKGDEELVDLDGRVGWHLPQTEEGLYAGHHFADGAEAVEQLERLRARGAGFFVLPGSSWWWLEHYPELTAHLERHHATVVREEGVCLIVDLRSAKALAEDDRLAAYDELVARLRALVDRSVPADAAVAVASKGDARLLMLGGRATRHLPQAEDGVYAGYHPADSVTAIAQLEAAREGGARFFVLPETQLWWLDHYDEFARHLDAHCTVVAREPGVGVVYRLGRRSPRWRRRRTA